MTVLLCPSGGIRGDSPHPEGSVSKVYFGAAPTDGMGVRRLYHQVHPGTGCLAHPHYICEFEAPCLRLGDKEAPLLRPGARLRSSTCMKGNSEVAAAECDKSHGDAAGRTSGGGGYPRREGRVPGPPIKLKQEHWSNPQGWCCNNDWRWLVTEAH